MLIRYQPWSVSTMVCSLVLIPGRIAFYTQILLLLYHCNVITSSGSS